MAVHFTMQEVREVWRLSSGSRIASAVLSAHPSGTELRLVLDGSVEQRYTHGEERLLLDQAYTWRECMIINGWN